MAQVEIYTKMFCGFCVRAKELLKRKEIEFTEYGVDGGGPKKDEMVERAGGRTTVPQIFIGNKHVGGCDELMALEREGKLDTLLARA
ncbi:glutaredoxin 3 [Sphingomicrobium marinum]|uniref:glutaredoxin 3 n=1 Tax=Sphingomicrobium marinum TaxID=1227950 RepID=UPI002240DEF9|nr:glutaredoxin 3 [Sphingomicrobium marinum]